MSKKNAIKICPTIRLEVNEANTRKCGSCRFIADSVEVYAYCILFEKEVVNGRCSQCKKSELSKKKKGDKRTEK
jgi:hypothetical protein